MRLVGGASRFQSTAILINIRPMHVSAAFESGSIEVVEATDPGNIRLRIPTDSASDYRMWFYFRVSGVRATELRLAFENAGECSYPSGWDGGYRVSASYDREDWFRVPTTYDGTTMTVSHRPERDWVYYAYFAPYTAERQHDFVGRCLASPLARHEVLGASPDGNDIELMTIGEAGAEKRACWLIARHHPGETQGSFWLEGLCERLLDGSDPVARRLLERAVFHVVPNINPDGSRRGNHRTNAVGKNLNRAWAEPTMEKTPEVFLVRERMQAIGVDFLIDAHAVEYHPYTFIISGDRVPSLSDRLLQIRTRFDEALAGASPDHATEYGYPREGDRPLQPTLCSSWVAEEFACLALTLEMPFNDHAALPDPRAGWSPQRSHRLGAATLEALNAVVDDLR